MRAHLLVVNKRGETLIDGAVEDFNFQGEWIHWVTTRVLGEQREEHEHELAASEISHLSWAVYTQDTDSRPDPWDGDPV
jgi:hypothetical protein